MISRSRGSLGHCFEPPSRRCPAVSATARAASSTDSAVGLQADPGQPRSSRCGDSASASIRSPVTGSTSSGSSSPAGRPSSAARLQPLAVERVRCVAEAEGDDLLRRAMRASGRHTGRCRRAPPCAGTPGADRRARRPQRPERVTETCARSHAAVDLIGREVVVEQDLSAADAGHGTHRVVGVGDHQEGEIRRTEERRGQA